MEIINSSMDQECESKVPNDFVCIKILTDNNSYTITQAGRYRITVIGSGGAGGNGRESTISGSGGGSGGVCISEYDLSVGDVIKMINNSVYNTISINDVTDDIRAGVGGAGYRPSAGATSRDGGSGGTATGGNKHNLPGNKGENSYSVYTSASGAAYTQEQYEICPFLSYGVGSVTTSYRVNGFYPFGCGGNGELINSNGVTTIQRGSGFSAAVYIQFLG